MTTGDRIHFLRNDLDLTLQDLGDKVGVGASTVRKWEKGLIQSIRADKVQKLAAALNTSVDYLMGWTDNSVTIGSVGTNNGVIGQNSGELHISEEYSKEEIELIRVYNSLSVKDRIKLLNFAWSLEDNAT